MTDQETTVERLSCGRCGISLQPGTGNFYRVTIEAVADPTFSAEDQGTDLRQEIERLLARLEVLSEQEAMNQIYRRLVLFLCGRCYRRWIDNPMTGRWPKRVRANH
jgi:hypothetical protein